METLVCRLCHREQPVSTFYLRQRRGKSSYEQPCRLCKNARKRQRYEVKQPPKRPRSSAPDRKVCTACRQEYPLDAFLFRPKRGKYVEHCHPCRTARKNAAYAAKQALKPPKAAKSTKICRHCHEEKSLEQFKLARLHKKRLIRSSYCRSCLAMRRTEEWRRKKANDPEGFRSMQRHRTERYRAYNTHYMKTHRPQINANKRRRHAENPAVKHAIDAKRSALKRGAAKVEKIALDELYQRDHQICHLCHQPVRRQDATMDHLVPLSANGNHSWDNVALAHRRCNSRRGAGRLPAQLRLF